MPATGSRAAPATGRTTPQAVSGRNGHRVGGGGGCAGQNRKGRDDFIYVQAPGTTADVATPECALIPPPRPRSFCVAKGAFEQPTKIDQVLAGTDNFEGFATVQLGAVSTPRVNSQDPLQTALGTAEACKLALPDIDIIIL